MSYANHALKCFEENIQFYANAKTAPEKYNLYNGLGNLARAIENMQSELNRLQQEVDDLRRNP